MLTKPRHSSKSTGFAVGPRDCGKALHRLATTLRTASMMLSLAAAGVVLAGELHAQPLPTDTSGVTGIWIDDTGQGAVEIAMCGDRLCGRVVWLKAPADRTGKPIVDANNPDPARRKQPVCGLPVLGDLVRQRDGSWDGGWIYDPKEGKSYDVEVKLLAPDRLQVMGYMKLKFLSETLQWTRAPQQIDRCRATSNAKL